MASLHRAVLSLVIAGCALSGEAGAPATGPDLPFRVIVHPEVTGGRVDRATLSAIFLRKSQRWSDSTPAQPVDQSARAPVRAAFSEYVHGQPIAAVLRFWMRQISDGRGVPPPVKESDAEVIAFVASKRGSVGYVTAVTPIPGTVRMLQIAD